MPDERNKTPGPQGDEDRGQQAPGRNPQGEVAAGDRQDNLNRQKNPYEDETQKKREEGGHTEGGRNERNR